MKGKCSLPKTARVRRRNDVASVLRRQQKAVGRHVVVLVLPRSAKRQDRARIGVIVSRKVSHSSPRRHTLKRWVKELFRCELQQQLPLMDVVVLFRLDPPPQGHPALREEIRRLLKVALQAQPQPQPFTRGRRS